MGSPGEKPARARHHTDLEGLRGIRQDRAIKPSRADDPPVPGGIGIHLEVEPFGSILPGKNGPKAQTGAAGEGAYVEIDLPDNAIPYGHIGPRNTVVIPMDKPLRVEVLNPRFVKVRQWWNLWYCWKRSHV